MTEQHEQFLQRVCSEVDRITAEYLPEGLSLEDVHTHVRIIVGKNPLGENLRVLGNDLFVRLETINFDKSSSLPGQRTSQQKGDKFLGKEIFWVRVEHISSICPGKKMEIDGSQSDTCYVSVMEEQSFRIKGTCEEFFDFIQDPLTKYQEQLSMSSREDTTNEDDDEIAEEMHI